MSTESTSKEQQTVTPYLIIPNGAGFIDFTLKVFGAAVTERHPRPDSDLIMHGNIRIGNSDIMFADSTEQYPPQPGSLFIYVDNADNTYKKALDAGATGITEPADQEYGRSCGITDPCGNTWWVTSLS